MRVAKPATASSFPERIMEPKRDIEIAIEERREMTETEVETVATLLFRWWREEFERDSHDEARDQK